MPRSRAETIVNAFLEANDTIARQVITECARFGITPNKAMKIYAQYGEESMNILKQTPYRICELDGIDFRTADKIALNVVFTGAPFDSTAQMRLKACVMHVAKQNLARGNLYILDYARKKGGYTVAGQGIIPEAIEILNRDSQPGQILVTEEMLLKTLEILTRNGELKKLVRELDENESANYYYLPYALKAEDIPTSTRVRRQRILRGVL